MIRRILADNAIDRETEADVTRFKEALIAWFDTRTTINEVETTNLVLETLRQGKDEVLSSYYNRTKGFLEEAGEQDFRETTRPQIFSIFERSFLNSVIAKFMRRPFQMRRSWLECWGTTHNPTGLLMMHVQRPNLIYFNSRQKKSSISKYRSRITLGSYKTLEMRCSKGKTTPDERKASPVGKFLKASPALFVTFVRTRAYYLIILKAVLIFEPLCHRKGPDFPPL